MNYITLADHAMRDYQPDRIFAISRRARQASARMGGEAVVNATLGECVDEEGALMVLPIVDEMLHAMPAEEFCRYAPIGGIPGFKDAVVTSLFGDVPPHVHVEAVPTPGGCGALRHVIWNFLEQGEAALTADWHWTPYRTICEEHGRRLETFDMFNRGNRFHLKALEEKMRALLKVQDRLVLILNTPANNPTGAAMTPDEMEAVADLIRECCLDRSKKITLCLDASYIDFAGTFQETRRIFRAVEELPPNAMAVVIFSMSKSYTMCGMRSGAVLCMAGTKEAAGLFQAAMCYSSRGVWSNAIRSAQKILVDICGNPKLKERADAEREHYRKIITRRGKVFLEEAGICGLECCPYESGYFLAVPCENPEAVSRSLEEKLIFTVPMEKGLRFSPCAVSEEKCRRSPKIIKEVLEGQKR